jgi:hypothetical protein
MLVILVPIAGMVLDVTGKVYSNMFFPTQSQIHVEIFCTEKDRDSSKPKGVDDLKLSVQGPANV